MANTDYLSLRRGVYEKKSKYVDIGINGKLFPSWLLANFRQFKMPQTTKTDEDPCAKNTSAEDSSEEDSNSESKAESKAESRKQLNKYQEFIGQYLSGSSPYRSILIYHGLGVGKTASSINIYNVLYNADPNWNVYILVKASLKQGWLDELGKWLEHENNSLRFKNIRFIHYDSPNAEKNFIDARKSADLSKKSLYIVDEVHNLIRNVYGNIEKGTGKAKRIYDMIIQDKQDSPDTRIVLISGTPAINKPFELGLLFNLLRPNIFPKTETEFNRIFVEQSKKNSDILTINKVNMNMFQRRIMGLVSYYMATPLGVYAEKKEYVIETPMSNYHEETYNMFEDIEEKIAAKAKARGGSQVYRSYTRQASNFVFPPLSQTITGTMRPRPSKFKIPEKEATKFMEGENTYKVDEHNRVLDTSGYIKALKSFIDGTKNYFKSKHSEDEKTKHTIKDDVSLFVETFKGDFKKFVKESKVKSKLFDAMYMCSSKMVNIIFNIMNSPGPTIVYSNYVNMEGLEIFKIYLDFFGFYNLTKSKKVSQNGVGFVEFHGGIDVVDRKNGMMEFNRKENRYGSIVKIILISPAGSEGLNLRNVRQIHVMEPYWNEVRIKQIIGRGIRQCSHSDLPLNERMVDIFRYQSVRDSGSKQTTDQLIDELAKGKESLINSFLEAIREVAVDCELFKEQNMTNDEYKCFKFKQESFVGKNVGPAYKENIMDDMQFNDGNNDPDSMTVKIKAMKIKASILMSKPSEEPKFSSPDYYWWHSDSGMVYDYELYYPVGRVATTDDGTSIKIDKDTYLIVQLAIPLLSS